MRNLLITVRKKNGITVEQIASELGISSSFYYKIEQGVRNPTIFLAKRIAEKFGFTVDELFFNKHLDITSKTSNKTSIPNSANS